MLVKLVDKAMQLLKSEYEKIFKVIFRFPKATIVLVLLLVFSMRFIIPFIENNFMPTWDEDIITVKIEMPQGSTIDRTLKVTKFAEQRIKQIPEMESYLTSIGEGGVENSVIVVNLVPSQQRKRADTDIIKKLIPFSASIPDAEVTIERGESRGGMIAGDISINVYGQDYQKMIELSKMMKQKMDESGYFRSVKSSYRMPRKEIQFIPN